MSAEAAVTVLLYAILFLLATSGIPGAIIAVAWLGVGGWFVAKTKSRGFWADISFAATWPIYVVLGR